MFIVVDLVCGLCVFCVIVIISMIVYFHPKGCTTTKTGSWDNRNGFGLSKLSPYLFFPIKKKTYGDDYV